MAGLVAAVYAACQLAKSQDIPSDSAWGRHDPLNLVLVGTGIATLISGTLVLYGYGRILKRTRTNEDLEAACKGAWHLAVRELHVPRHEMDKVGVHVWSVRGLWGARYLDKRATFTLRRRGQTRVFWRKGIGAIGTAWALNEALVASVEDLETLAANETAFRKLDRETRYGLTWSEFRKASHYRSILAIPLEIRPDHVAGCLSIDVQLDGYAAALDTLSGLDEISVIRDICEQALS